MPPPLSIFSVFHPPRARSEFEGFQTGRSLPPRPGFVESGCFQAALGSLSEVLLGPPPAPQTSQ
eukprot:5331843-Amphidinium_carterae.1